MPWIVLASSDNGRPVTTEMNNNKSDDHDVFCKTSMPTKFKGVGSESVLGRLDCLSDVWTNRASVILGEVLLHVEGTADKARGGALPSMGYIGIWGAKGMVF